MKVSSIYSSKLNHIDLLKGSNVNLSYFPDLNREKVINQNEKYLLVWDIDKSKIVISQETKNSKNLIFIDRDNRNKNFSSLLYNQHSAILSSNITYKNKEWKMREGKKITSEFESQEIETITFMCRLEEYHCTHNDRILTGYSNGYIALFKFNSSALIKKFKAHNMKINDILHLKENNVNHFASCSDDFTIKIWDFSTISLINILKGHFQRIINLKYLKFVNYHYIASSSSDSNTIIWNYITGEALIKLDNESSVTHTLYLYDYKPAVIVNATKDNKLFFWRGNENRTDHRTSSYSFKELKYFGKINQDNNINHNRQIFLEKVKLNQIIIKEKEVLEELIERNQNFFEINKKQLEEKLDKNVLAFGKKEVNKFIKNIKGESKYKIESETSISSLASNNLIPENIKEEKQYINFIFKLININDSVDSYNQIVSEIKKYTKIDPYYFFNMKIFDPIKTTLFPVKDNFKLIKNIKNINYCFKYRDSTSIERVQIFIDYILSLEKIYYSDKIFFEVKKENIFYDLKSKKLKIISYYVPYETSFDWSVKFRTLNFWKEKEEYLKTTIINFRKFCFNNCNLTINMDEQAFSFEGQNNEKQFFWKNRNIFILKLISNYLRKFIKSTKKAKIFGFLNKRNILNKQFRSIEKVKNYFIYFYSKNLKEK